ncbi:TonB-dependent receptor plug domain-containing protein [Caulobacter sp. KR2-114]|uniref:TonB-dependent receptor plug domain-containing protein n=1 Tax=Caulobacter sp. KR2-114 TaxID=3400912 RepID=UPI003C1196BB
MKTSILLSGASAFALIASATAHAQTPGADASANAPPTVDEVVVTGSRISRSDFKAESPVSTLTSAAIAASGQPSLDRVVGQLPQFEAAQGAAEVGDVQGSIGFGGGASYSDLRGIGRNRSLVLMDGRRLMPSTPDGSIDLNTIPMSMIDNVEVVTGGASTAYGSDAVAGVANFKLRRNVSGLELSVQHGATSRGDGATNQVSVLFGGKFDDGKGNAMLDFEYSSRDAVAGSQRPFFTQPSVRFLGRPPEGIIFAGGWGAGATAPTIAAVNAVLAGYSSTTPIPGSGAYRGAIGVNTDQSLYTSANPASCAQNYKGVGAELGAIVNPNCTTAGVVLGNYFAVQVPLTKYNLFAKGEYEFTSHITGYAQFNFSDSSALDQTSPGSTKTSASAPQELIIPVSNPYVQSNAALMSLLNSAYGGTPPAGSAFYYSKLLFGWGQRVQDFHYTVWQALAGLKGDIPGSEFTWDLYASYGRSSYNAQAHGDISITAINKVLASEGVGGCNWNPFGIQSVSTSCISFAGRTDNTSDTLTAKNIEFSIQGPVFNLPAGPLKVALGGDYRQSQYAYQPDSLFVSGDSLSYGTDTPSQGAQDAKELFAEVLAPVLRDQAFAKEVSLDLAYRYSKYNSFSGRSTWKADGSWTVFEGVRIRGGYSVAIRAPSLADLYVGKSVSNQNVTTDPCDIQSSYRTGANAAQVQALCAAQSAAAGSASFTYNGGVVSIPIQSGGNSLLQPETANTWSIGTVLSPLHGLNIAIDYYNINIAGAIASLSPNQILSDCYGSAANPSFSASNSFCGRVQRDPSTGSISLLTSGTFNFNTIRLDGVDAQVDYTFELSNLGLPEDSGRIQVATVVSYLNHFTVTPSDGTATTEYAGQVSDGLVTSDGENLYTHPRWKANSSLTYSRGPFTGAVRWRYIGGMNNLDAPGSLVPATSYFDIEAHYAFGKRLILSAGINNLADQAPPFIGTLELRTDAATYDVIGRSWYIAAKFKF